MIIDVHGHLSPPEAARRFPMPPSLTDLDGLLASRDRAGIDLTILGSPVGAGAMMRVPGVDNYRQPRDRLRAFHGWLSGVVHRHPDRLRAYVYANPLGDDDHLDGVRETLEDDAFVGLIINSSVAGRLLTGPDADPFFALAAEADRPVLVHPPAEPVGGPGVADFAFVEQVGRFCDVTAGLAMLAFAGWLEKYPGLRLIGATGGGAVASLPEKLDLAARPRHWGPGAPPPRREAGRSPGEALRRLYVDTAAPSRTQLAANVAVLGADHVLFGTDSPPLASPLDAGLGLVRDLDVPDSDKALILGGNAQRLFGLVPAGSRGGA
jgi:aminocarboxymuconate-semialdehyde decarboxylase